MNTIFEIKGKNEIFEGTGQQAIKNVVKKYPQFSTLVSRLFFPVKLVAFTKAPVGTEKMSANDIYVPDLRPHWERRTPKKATA